MTITDLILAGLAGITIGGAGMIMATTVALRTSRSATPAHQQWRHTGVRVTLVGFALSALLVLALDAGWPRPTPSALAWQGGAALAAMGTFVALMRPWTREWDLQQTSARGRQDFQAR